MNNKDQKIQVALVLSIASVLTAIIMGISWWHCDFTPIPQCFHYRTK